MSRREDRVREEVIRVCRLLWERGYVAATDGNVSVRIDDERLIATPSGFSKGFLSPEQLVVTDLDGKLVQPSRDGASLRPSSELPMHCAAYRARSDIGAVIHAHPPVATACTLAGVSLQEGVLPEVLVNLGGVPTTRYARPATAAGAKVIEDLVREYDALLLPHHGTLTVGESAFDAYLKLEKVENAAQVLLAAHQLGGARLLPAQEVQDMLALYRQRKHSGLPE